jgi:hypothetical protein
MPTQKLSRIPLIDPAHRVAVSVLGGQVLLKRCFSSNVRGMLERAIQAVILT